MNKIKDETKLGNPHGIFTEPTGQMTFLKPKVPVLLPIKDVPYRDVLTGMSGEYLAMSKFAAAGISATKIDHRPFDLLVPVTEHDEKHFHTARVQVKTSGVLKKSYSFSITKGYHGSQSGARSYSKNEFDVLCLVCLHNEKAVFVAGVHDSWTVSQEQFNQENAFLNTWHAAVDQVFPNWRGSQVA